ncbi:hypothetical protein FE257_006472 [Aspergillus nanangensis]|uniref:Uncharacterized protein n=1 Tax=Aspergillus nanangensis TaxID=2582783 RepID=A0AAD4CXK1_ASPNN|nr:hypothetical protein FE257_006472 [Aspergillus nanangensis]
MTSTPPPDHTPKSLGESWATLSASDIHSEDGTPSEQTDMGSLIDQPGPDDVASLDERYSSSEIDGNEDERFEENYDTKSNISESQELTGLFPQIRSSIDDSNLTTKTAFRQSPESIEFVEPENWPEAEQVESKRTICVFDSLEASKIKTQFSTDLRDCILTASVQQTMTRKSLDTDKPFRVLYTGDPEFRNIILDKVGDVLVSSTSSGFESSSTESLRYHVVPTSFGVGAVPNYAELLPIHVQLVVDECSEAVSETQTNGPSKIELELKNRPACASSWSGREYTISSPCEWSLPDIAIIFLSSTDTEATMETQKLVRIFMERHGVPVMLISEKPLWETPREFVPLNPHSLHMCLESRHPLTGKTSVMRRYPIDLRTFESIFPGQLNRNLASLASLYPKKPCKTISESPNPTQKKSIFAVENYAKKIFPLPYMLENHELAPAVRLLALLLLSVVVISLGYSGIRVAFIFFSQLFASTSVSDLSTSESVKTVTSIVSVQRAVSVSPSALSSSSGQLPVLGTKFHKRPVLDDLLASVVPISEQNEQSNSYEIQVVGDCHLVIKSPNTSSSGKKHQKFSVQVSRRGQGLDYELSQLFDGVYTLKLDRGDAYGIVNVTITTSSWPAKHQTTSVDFGTPWLKIANWKRAAQTISSQLMREFNTAQTGLSEVYGRLSTDLQVVMGDVVKRAHLIRREAESFRRDSVQASLGTKEVVLSRSKQLSEAVRRNAVQPFLAVSSVLQGHTNEFNREAREIMSDTWTRISTRAQGFDLSTMLDHVRNASKCKALDTAQKRARGLMRRQKRCRRAECSP